MRDGLKPVHRRILYSMYKNGLSPSAKFKKSATVVGDVLGSITLTVMRRCMTPWCNSRRSLRTRYPLVLGQGNFGSVDVMVQLPTGIQKPR